jgi:hypothetical protein
MTCAILMGLKTKTMSSQSFGSDRIGNGAVSLPSGVVDVQKFYTVKEVAEILRFKSDWVRRHFGRLSGVIHCGNIRHGRRRYNTILIPGSVLLKWILSRAVPTPGFAGSFTKTDE